MSVASRVYVVEDDPGVSDSLFWLFKSAGLNPQLCPSISDFRQSYLSDETACVVLDVQLPDGNGLNFLTTLNTDYPGLPVIFITAYGDVSSAVRAMRGGAIDFLEKPFDEGLLLSRVQEALASRSEQSTARGLIARLTPREHEILDLVIEGLSTRKIAAQLHRSEKTVEGHRHNIMKKLEATSVAQIVHIGTLAR